MSKETIGVILGWGIVTIVAWFLALFVMAYPMGEIRPWYWTMEERILHLGIQFVLVLLYGFYVNRPRA